MAQITGQKELHQRHRFSVAKDCIIPAIVVCLLSVTIPCAAKDIILSVLPAGDTFIETYNSLADELSGDFEVKPYFIVRKNSSTDLRNVLRREHPRCIVLMDNASITLYRKIQSTLPADSLIIPSVSIMGIMIEDAITGLRNACGIAYEIPVVTSVVNLRSILDSPVKTIGIIHRTYLDGFLRRNARFCSKEKIKLISVPVSNNKQTLKKQLRKAFKSIIKQNVDALWVPNDNILLHSDYLRYIWIPKAKQLGVPVIVGIETLVNPDLDFGTLAVTPDHTSLGKQTADKIYEIMDNNWQCTGNRQVDPALAIYKILNMHRAIGAFRMPEEKLGSIDKKLE